MYYLLYGLLYLLSLLPFGLLYALSDVLAFLLRNVVGYRKDVVRSNISTAFPDKGEEEIRQIMKDFYRNLSDMILETIKLLSIGEAEFARRNKFETGQMNEFLASGKNVEIYCAHQFNWEWGNRALSIASDEMVLGVYKKIRNKASERLFQKLRYHPNQQLIAMEDFGPRILSKLKYKHVLGLIADQNPSNPSNSYWLNLFNRPTPFLKGPEKSAKMLDMAVVFVTYERIKRGHYVYKTKALDHAATNYKDGEITVIFRDFLEQIVNKAPGNYLWSHKRWKHDWRPEYAKNWVDNTAMPVS